jgi:hypothetical protein
LCLLLPALPLLLAARALKRVGSLQLPDLRDVPKELRHPDGVQGPREVLSAAAKVGVHVLEPGTGGGQGLAIARA